MVLVTVLDEPTYGKAYVQTIRENRERYAAFHGRNMIPRPLPPVGFEAVD